MDWNAHKQASASRRNRLSHSGPGLYIVLQKTVSQNAKTGVHLLMLHGEPQQLARNPRPDFQDNNLFQRQPSLTTPRVATPRVADAPLEHTMRLRYHEPRHPAVTTKQTPADAFSPATSLLAAPRPQGPKLAAEVQEAQREISSEVSRQHRSPFRAHKPERESVTSVMLQQSAAILLMSFQPNAPSGQSRPRQREQRLELA